MNLIGDPWIPVVGPDGPCVVGLGQLFDQAQSLQDLALNPPCRIAVMRLLLCIVHAALDGPEDAADWRACRQRIIPESLSYLERHRQSFELFGARPFLQVPAIDPTDNATVDKLDFGLAAGNNDTLFDHGGSREGRVHSPAWIALQLLTYLCFSPGGTIGQTTWAGSSTGANSAHAPCLEESLLHTFLRGGCLLESLQLNLVPLADLGVELGRPVWEIDIDGQQTPVAESLRRSYLGRLVPLSRAILLAEGSTKCTLVDGLSFPKLPDGREPFATEVVKGKGEKKRHGYVRMDLTRHPWREAPSVLSLGNIGKLGGPRTRKRLIQDDVQGNIDLWMGGLAADKGKIIDTGEWMFSFNADLVRDENLSIYAAGVKDAQQGAAALSGAIKAYAAMLKADPAGFRRAALSNFWTALDQQCIQLVNLATAGQKLDPWRQTIRDAMRRAYAAACPHRTARQIQAHVRGQRFLVLQSNRNRKKGDAA